ncbi:MAG: molecular chaperone TorD family protein [Deltaproteobacteria bacterium]|nr:molecular chaperone TorD family protein [Deltaproteobacteria bacterium]
MDESVMIMDSSSIGEAKARGNVYSLLSRVFMREVDKQFLDILKKRESIDAFRDHGFTFFEDLLSRREGDLIDELAVEFASLFLISPGRLLSPYESVQAGKEGQLGGEASSKTLFFYKKAGFTIHERISLLPDHFAIELEFMGHLCERGDAANGAPASNSRELQARFIKLHLANWYRPFLNRVEAAAGHPFYREFSIFTKGFLDSEIGYLESAKGE